jgi:hypothetical protein
MPAVGPAIRHVLKVRDVGVVMEVSDPRFLFAAIEGFNPARSVSTFSSDIVPEVSRWGRKARPGKMVSP